jgi:hypothetical protein
LSHTRLKVIGDRASGISTAMTATVSPQFRFAASITVDRPQFNGMEFCGDAT